jgi:hypothetical protein
MRNSVFSSIGKAVKCASENIDVKTLPSSEAFCEMLDSHPEWGNTLLKLGAAIYGASSKAGSLGHVLYSELSEVPWNENFYCFSEAVGETLSDSETGGYEEKSATFENFIRAIPFFGKNLAGALLKGGPDLLRSVASLAAMGGGAGGALTWLLNRHATRDSGDIEALHQRALHYEHLAGQLEEKLKRRQLLPVEEGLETEGTVV